MITAVIPTYKNPEYLHLCLRSALENSVCSDTQIIVVIDGFLDMYQDVLNEFKSDKIFVLPLSENAGMPTAINYGVWSATTEHVLVVNDDNVFPKRWDDRILKNLYAGQMGSDVFSLNQIEPSPSIFDFVIRDFGKDIRSFQYENFLEEEYKLSSMRIDDSGELFPFVITKSMFMKVGGFDTSYNSPFWVDCDFWLKLELNGATFFRMAGIHLYHFGSIATKKSAEANKFNQSENHAAQLFNFKWGFVPNIVERTKHNNRKGPLEKQIIKGVQF